MGVGAKDGMEVLRKRQRGCARTEIQTKGNVTKLQCVPAQAE